MFNEKDHPRAKDGTFTDKEKLEQIYNTVHNDNAPKKQKKEPKTKDEFFGEEYKGLKGNDAIEKLLKEKQGHVKGAFFRKEIGDIDLPWGDENGGLQHVIKRRDEMLLKGSGNIGGVEMVKKIPDIIENGIFDIDTLGRPGFILNDCRVAIRPSYDGIKLNWVVSAMEIIKK